MFKQFAVAALEFLIEVILAIFTAAIVEKYLNLDEFQSILLGIVAFIGINIIYFDFKLSTNLNHVVNILGMKSKWEETLENTRHTVRVDENIIQLSDKLRDIADGLEAVVKTHSSAEDFFPAWYEDKLNRLKDHIFYTTHYQSYHFDGSVIQEQSRMYKVFRGEKEDFFWATVDCEMIPLFATPEGEIFLRAIDERVRSGQITNVKRLFIFDSPDQLETLTTKLCFCLHIQSGYDFRIISSQDFETLLYGFGDRNLVPDFGIYGTYYVWETPPKKIFTERGYICMNDAKIKKYTALFKTIWANASNYSSKNIEELNKKYSQNRLFEFRTILDSEQLQ